MSDTPKVQVRVFDARALVAAVDGEKRRKVAYEFSGGRKFYHPEKPYQGVQAEEEWSRAPKNKL